ADLLRYRVEAQERDLVPELHRRASEWFEHEGLANEAIQHAVQARDWQRTLRLVYGAVEPLMTPRQLSTIEGGLNAIPEEALARAPFLCAAYASALLSRSDWKGVDRVLGLAEAGLQGEAQRSQLSMLWSIRAFAAYARRDAARAAECAARARELVAGGVHLESLASTIATALANLVAGRPADAMPTLVEALEISRELGHVFAENATLAYIGQARAMQGRLREAAASVEQVLLHEGRQYPEHFAFAQALLAEIA